MKKPSVFIIIIIISIFIMALSMIMQPQSDVQKILKASNRQFEKLSEYLSEINISIDTISPSTNKLVDDIGDGFEAYDIITTNHESYVLILASSNKSYVAIIDPNGNLVEGLIDNYVLPQLFK